MQKPPALTLSASYQLGNHFLARVLKPTSDFRHRKPISDCRLGKEASISVSCQQVRATPSKPQRVRLVRSMYVPARAFLRTCWSLRGQGRLAGLAVSGNLAFGLVPGGLAETVLPRRL